MKKILYFSAPWCGPCKTLGPIIDALSSTINVEKINVDVDQTQSTKYGVRNIPTLVLVENGVEKNRLIGLKSQEDILNFYHG
jgi:thioredoxin 1